MNKNFGNLIEKCEPMYSKDFNFNRSISSAWLSIVFIALKTGQLTSLHKVQSNFTEYLRGIICLM